MGRYYDFSNGDRGKFWFGIQLSSDLLEFGGCEGNNDIHVEWSSEDMPVVKESLVKILKDLQTVGYPIGNITVLRNIQHKTIEFLSYLLKRT